jgi:hypothetical protein
MRGFRAKQVRVPRRVDPCFPIKQVSAWGSQGRLGLPCIHGTAGTPGQPSRGPADRRRRETRWWRGGGRLRFRPRDLSRPQSGAPDGPGAPGPGTRARPIARRRADRHDGVQAAGVVRPAAGEIREVESRPRHLPANESEAADRSHRDRRSVPVADRKRGVRTDRAGLCAVIDPVRPGDGDEQVPRHGPAGTRFHARRVHRSRAAS